MIAGSSTSAAQEKKSALAQAAAEAARRAAERKPAGADVGAQAGAAASGETSKGAAGLPLYLQGTAGKSVGADAAASSSAVAHNAAPASGAATGAALQNTSTIAAATPATTATTAPAAAWLAPSSSFSAVATTAARAASGKQMAADPSLDIMAAKAGGAATAAAGAASKIGHGAKPAAGAGHAAKAAAGAAGGDKAEPVAADSKHTDAKTGAKKDLKHAAQANAAKAEQSQQLPPGESSLGALAGGKGGVAAHAGAAGGLAAAAGGGGADAAGSAPGAASGDGGGGEGGGATMELGQGDESKETEVQEKTRERIEAAAPERAQQDAASESEPGAAAAEPASSGGGEGGAGEAGGSAGAEARVAAGDAGGGEASGSADAAGGDAGGEAPAATIAAPPETAIAKADTDPAVVDRSQAQVERRGEQNDTRDAAEQGSEERSEDQAEQQAESGGSAGGGEGAQMDSGEKGAGMASLSEDVGGSGAGAGGGGGGGGGGTPVPEPEAAPDTANGDPEAGLGAAATLQPMQAAQALDGVGGAIDNTAKQESAALQDEIPQVEVGGDGGASAVIVDGDGEAVAAPEKTKAEASTATPEAAPLPAAPPSPTESIATPAVADSDQGTVNAEDASRMQQSVSDIPTTDPGLDVSAGPAPTLQLNGDARPSVVADDKAKLDQTVAQQNAKGAVDAAKPAGENNIRVTTPKETVKASKMAEPAAGGAAGDVAAPDEAVGVIAEEKKGSEVRAAAAKAQGEMADKRAEHQTKVGEEKSKNDEEMAKLKEENVADQAAEKASARGEVAQARAEWSAEQKREVGKANEKAGAEVSKGNEKINTEQKNADEESAKHIADGEKEAAGHKAEAEGKAAKKKAEAKEEDSGFFSWVASKVSSFFDALKSAVGAIFDAAKKLVRAAIDAAKKLAVAVIEKARKAIVAAIHAVGDALMAIGDVLLAAFPGLKAKWRRYIEDKVRAAEKAVNALADKLKKGVTKLLDMLGKAFEFLLDAYKKAMLAVLSAAKAAALGAINFAKNVAAMIGAFIGLVKDIAKSPGEWISKLGAAVMDGVKNHLWTAFKSAIKEWFNAKLEEVLGVGMTIWNVLKEGGISIKEVGTMAFEALKAAIPAALIQLLIEKVVAMIIPAAGAVMAIIEGLQAAWGTVQKIIAALGKFVSFLKAVKNGGAGPQFAELLAAAAIVVIDFVANWLLKKLRGPASKVSSKIKAIAQKIMAKIKKVLKKIGGALKKAGRWIKGKFKGVKKKYDDWKAKRKAKKDAKAGKDGKHDAGKKKQDQDAEKRERLDKAVATIQPAIEGMASGRPFSRLLLRIRLAIWKARFRLSKLEVKVQGDKLVLDVRVNPTAQRVLALLNANPERVRTLIYDIANTLFKSPAAQAKLKSIAQQKAAGKGDDASNPITVSGPGALPGFALWRRDKRAKGEHVQFGAGGGTAHTRRTWGGSADRPGNQWVAGAGKWRDVDQHYVDMAGPKGTEAGAASQLARALRGQAPQAGYAGQADEIARQAALIGTEASRSSPNLVMLPHGVDDVAHQRVSAPSAVFGADVSPAAAEGDAVKSMHGADAQVGEEFGKPYQTPASDVRINEVIAQQIHFLQNRIVLGMKAKQLAFKDEAQLKSFIKNDLQDWLQSGTNALLL